MTTRTAGASNGLPLAVDPYMRTTTALMLSLALAAGAAAPLAASSASIDRDTRGVARASSGQKPKPKPAKPQKAEKKAEKEGTRRGDASDRVFDRDGHVRVIGDYARRGLPPGLAKREALPPGLRRQIRERGELPPGLQTRLVDVPAEWTSHLPSIGRYERRYFAGNDLIVVDTRTNGIVAVIRDVLR